MNTPGKMRLVQPVRVSPPLPPWTSHLDNTTLHAFLCFSFFPFFFFPPTDRLSNSLRLFSSLFFCVCMRMLLQTLGASGSRDKDGEMIATLVNKGALDVIAKVRWEAGGQGGGRGGDRIVLTAPGGGRDRAPFAYCAK